MKARTFLPLMTSIAMIAALALAGGCTASGSTTDDSSQASASSTDVGPVGAGRFAVNSGAEADAEEEPYGTETCEENADGGWDCSWDDGAGTVCTYGVSADDVLLYQDCTGPWGEYNCDNTGAEIVCEWISDRGNCTDTWSLDYELIESTCEDYYEPTEECLEQDDGSWLCIYDDGYQYCEVVYDADGFFVSQACTDGYWSYNCLTVEELITCDLLVEGELLCTDTYDQIGNPVEMGCEEYYEEPTDPEDPEDPYYEECFEQDDGSWLCIYDDGYSYCEVVYDADGNFISQACTDGYYAYNCEATTGSIECELLIEGEQVCTDTYDPMGNPVVMGCDEYFVDPEDPEDPTYTEECTPTNDGGMVCTYDDGYWACTYDYDAAGMPRSVDCDSSDGFASYDCALDDSDGYLHCTMIQGEESCEDVIDGDVLISSTCDYYER